MFLMTLTFFIKIFIVLITIIFLDVEIDIEDLLTNPFNTQPPSLDDLEKLTGFRRDWIMFLYRNFKQVYFKFFLHKY